MKKYDWLKIAVIAQAIGMAALAAVVIIYNFPYLAQSDKNDEANSLREQQAEDEVVAIIAEKEIKRQQLVEELLELYGDRTLEQMLIHEAISMAAREQDITLSEEELDWALAEAIQGYDNEEQYFELMRTQLGLSQSRVLSDIRDQALLMKLVTQQIKVSAESVDAYLAKHAEELRPKQRMSLGWILSSSYEQASIIMDELASGADFATMAQLHSIDPYSSQLGGSLGVIDSDDPFYDEELLRQAAQLEIGSMTGPIQTDEGYAIVTLLGRQIEPEKTDAHKRDWAKRQLALEQINSLEEVKQKLLNHYVTVIRK